ncbi:vitamin K epoxide reductase family protein [Mucilaginibacter sp. MD40]|uniref:vitamin K epoxide reductase family protein n=1 Tax=Mucilaginibacter sp. MD40 TaxID=2029590 RepID=UPI00117EA845|nr:vitamin K epoxide reductase family protein [Mucilaginibacter sp. MD40]
MLFNNKPNNPEYVTVELLKAIGAQITDTEVTEELYTHPDYPNLLAVNDALNYYGADAAAYRINPEDLTDVPCPFIAHTKKPGAEYMMVKSISLTSVQVTGTGNGTTTMSLDDFKQLFDGVVLVPENTKIEKDTHASRPFNFDDVRYSVTLVLTIIIVIAGALLINNYLTTWQSLLVLVFKTAGLAVSALLLLQSIDKNNPLVQTLCGGGGKTNCNAILTSKVANVVKGLTWSDMGFFYFAGTWITVLFAGGNMGTLQLLAILNIVSLPYTIYSIYYQAKVAKQWCVLCCTVQVLLWLEFIPFVTLLTQPFESPSVQALARIILCLVTPAVLWLLIKPVIQKAQKAESLQHQLRGFKYNADLFNKLLQDQPKYSSPSPDWSIVLGNTAAENVITMVSNPYCPPCAKTHQIFDEWLKHNLDIQLRLVFTASNHEDDIKTPVTRHLMALNDNSDKSTVKKALHDWYEQKQKNYQEWAKTYPVNLDEGKFNKLKEQHDWCNLAEVKATPTILVNGYRLPDAYRIQDIKYLLVQQ